MALKHEKEHPMKPTRRMASIRTGCWCRGTAFPMSRKTFRLRSQSQPERIAKFPSGSSISTAYITASFWLTPLSLYGSLYGRHAGGSIRCRRRRSCGKGASFFWSRSRRLISANAGSISDHLMPGRWMPFAAASRSASGRLFRKEKTCLRKAIYRNSSGK